MAWAKGSEKRPGVAEVRASGEGVSVNLQASAEEQALSQETMGKMSTLYDMPAMQALQAKIQACSTLPQAEVMACIQKLQPESEKLAAANKARSDALEADVKSKRVKASWNCERLRLTARDGKITGEAECRDEVRFKVTGAVRCSAPKAKAAE